MLCWGYIWRSRVAVNVLMPPAFLLRDKKCPEKLPGFVFSTSFFQQEHLIIHRLLFPVEIFLYT